MDVKGTLKAVTLELRRELDGRYDAQGAWHPGDLERRLASIGVWRGREPKPLDELPRLVPDDREARRVVDAFLESRREARRSREDAIAEFVRDAAYTWANRLLALRCMEARGLIDEVILQKDAYGGRSLQHNRFAKKQPERCAGEDEGLFAALSDEFARRAEELPLLFDPRAPEVALRPSVAALKRCVSLLSGTSAVKGQEAATDEVFTAPDALGWTYQYWDTEEKDRVFEKVRTKKGFKIQGADIIPATCIYTEPYMVRFLVQNSLGALWMGMHPESKLADKWEYFVRGADRAPVSKKPVTEFTFLDPACGSGHFLVEAFELFYAMYVEEGVLTEPVEICASIMERNLYGIDIDERAVQIAALALVMKAKEKAPDFVPRRVNLVATNIRLPSGLEHVEAFLQKHPEDAPLKPALLAIFEGLSHADELGSLLQIEEPVDSELRHLRDQQLARERKAMAGSLFGPRNNDEWAVWKQEVISRLRQHFDAEVKGGNLMSAFFGEAAIKGLSLFEALSRRYDVVSANPPYMGTKNHGEILKRYVTRHFPLGKADLYTCFIERSIRMSTHYVALVTLHTWLFLQTFEELRAHLLQATAIEELVQLGRYAFSEADPPGNACMMVAAVHEPTIRHALRAFRIAQPLESERQAERLKRATHSFFTVSEQNTFRLIDGYPIAIGVPPKLLDVIRTGIPLGQGSAALASVVMGSSTKNDVRFLRWFWEVSFERRRWERFTKGGRYQRWCGLETHCVDWELGGVRPKTSVLERYPYLNGNYGWVIKHEEFHLRPGITYTNMARGSLGCRIMDRAIPGHSSHAIFPLSGSREGWLALLNSHVSSALLRIITQSLTFETGYVARLPVVEPAGLERLGSLAVREKEALVAMDPGEWSFDCLSYLSVAKTTLRRMAEVFVNESRLHSLNLLLLEGEIERQVWHLYGLDQESKDFVLSETGTPVALLPLAPGHAEPPSHLAKSLIGSDMRTNYHRTAEQLKSELMRLLSRASPSLDQEDPGQEDDHEDPAEENVGGRRIPSESPLEELSSALGLNPVSVYGLLRELQDSGKMVLQSQLVGYVENFLSVLILRLCGHRWPRQVDAGEAIPEAAAANGVIPITEGTRDSTLLARVRAHLSADFSAGRAGAIEREFHEMTGKPLATWLASDFFKRHISQFKKRPIVWQLASAPPGSAKRRGRGAAQSAPAFACLIYYHRLDSDLLPKLRTQYVGPLHASLQTELGALERIPERSDDQDARRVELEGKLEELKTFDARLEQVLTLGFASPALDTVAATEPLDKWCSRDGRAPASETVEAFLAQERRYDPDLNDGVRVNIAPLQHAGLLAADVLAAKDVEKAIADRAEWRADERRWCRERKLPQPGWWPVARAVDVPAIPDVLPAMDVAQEAMLFVWALLYAAGGSLTRMAVAHACALRCNPSLLRKYTPSDVQLKASRWADRVGQRTVAAGLLATVLSDLAGRDIVRLTTDEASRSVVTIGPQMPVEDKVDAWFRFEARLVLRVLAMLQPAQVQEIERGITGDDRKLLSAEAA